MLRILVATFGAIQVFAQTNTPDTSTTPSQNFQIIDIGNFEVPDVQTCQLV